MSETSEYFQSTYAHLEKHERDENDTYAQWYNLLVGEWDQLRKNETYGWQDAAELMGISGPDISVDGQFDPNKLADVLWLRAEELYNNEKKEQGIGQLPVTNVHQPYYTYTLDYHPFPPGTLPEPENTTEPESPEKIKRVNLVLYVKELLTEIGVEYTLASANHTVTDQNIVPENHLESNVLYQFYIPDFKKALFVTNEPKHATIILHNIREKEIKTLISSLTRIGAGKHEGLPIITHIFWKGDKDSVEAKKSWQEKTKAELLEPWPVKDSSRQPTKSTVIQAEKSAAQEYEYAGPDWHTRKSALSALGRKGGKILEPYIKKYKESHPQWFAPLRDTNHHKQEHLHVDFINTIRPELEPLPQAPNGWKSIMQIAEMTERSFATASDKLDELYPLLAREKQGDEQAYQIKPFSDPKKREFNYCSPELVRDLVIALTPKERKSDWLTTNALAEKLGIDLDKLKAVLEIFKTEFEEHGLPFSEELPSASKHIRTQYGPEVFAALQEYFELTKPAEILDNWLNAFELAKLKSISNKTVASRLAKMITQNPELSAYRQRGVRKGYTGETVYYAPELFDRI